jgi:hypothetical protein
MHSQSPLSGADVCTCLRLYVCPCVCTFVSTFLISLPTSHIIGAYMPQGGIYACNGALMTPGFPTANKDDINTANDKARAYECAPSMNWWWPFATAKPAAARPDLLFLDGSTAANGDRYAPWSSESCYTFVDSTHAGQAAFEKTPSASRHLCRTSVPLNLDVTQVSSR